MTSCRAKHTRATTIVGGLTAALLVVALALIAPPGAEAARNMQFGFVADQYGSDPLMSSDAATRNKWFKRLRQSGASLLRINAYWNQSVGGAPPAKPRNPRDPSYVFTQVDQAVRDAAKHGVTPVLTVVGAPRWAEGKNPPPESKYRVGSWKPNPGMLRDFATALAKRYSGKFRGADGHKLPRVRYFEAWTEPNHPQYLTPQWKGKKPYSPIVYRKLLNGFYKGVHSVHGNKVVLGGTGPFGDPAKKKKNVYPYLFWRQVMCLNNHLKKQKGCAGGAKRAHFDIYSHHPINAKKGKGPLSKPPTRDDGVPSNFGQLGRIVAAAQKQHTILPNRRHHEGWATETWYESKPPEKHAVGLQKQARFMEQDLYVLWKQHASKVFFLQIRDQPFNPADPPLVGFQSGIYFVNDKPKPSLRALQFPFVGTRKSKSRVVVWGIAPRTGTLQVTQKGKGPHRVARFRVRRGKVFLHGVRLRRGGKHVLVAQVGKRKSLGWAQR